MSKSWWSSEVVDGRYAAGVVENAGASHVFVDLVGGLKVQWVICVTDSDSKVKERVERMTAVGNRGGEYGLRPSSRTRRCRGLVVRERELRQSWWWSVECAAAAPQPPPNCTQTFAQGLRPIRKSGLCVAVAPNLVGPGNDVSQTQNACPAINTRRNQDHPRHRCVLLCAIYPEQLPCRRGCLFDPQTRPGMPYPACLKLQPSSCLCHASLIMLQTASQGPLPAPRCTAASFAI